MRKETFFRFLLGTLMLFSISVWQAHAQTASGNGWTLESGTLTITGDEAWQYYPIMGYIDETFAFDEYSDFVERIVIAEGVTYVPGFAFMTKYPMDFESGFPIIDYHATSVSISSTVQTIGFSAFRIFSSSLEVSFASPSQLRTLQSFAFAGTRLNQLTLPEGLETIEHDVFYNTDLVSVTLPSTLKTLGDCAFQACSNLTTIVSLATQAPSVFSDTFDFGFVSGSTAFTTLQIPDHAVGYDQGAWTKISDKITTEHVFHNGFCSADGCSEVQPATLAADGVYEIGNAGQLMSFARLVNGYGETPADRSLNARLTADIEMQDVTGWVPIGSASAAEAVTLTDPATLTTGIGYQGTFDGQNHTINHLSCTSLPGDVMNHGVFGVVEGTVRRLGVVAADIKEKSNGTNARGATLAGTIYPSGVVEACFAQDCTVGKQDVAGGLIAMSYGGTVRHSFTKNCNVSTSSSRYGAFCADGNNDKGVFPGTFVGCVTEDTKMCGGNRANITLTDCHVGTTAEEFAGGFIAFLLNDFGKETTFRQNLSGETPDAAPVLDESHSAVYASGTPLCPNDLASLSFSNTDSGETIEFPAAHPFDNGFCPHCDALQAANYVSTETENYYTVGNAGQLYWFAGLVNGTLTDGTAQNDHANLRLTADITDNEGVINGAGTGRREWPQLLSFYGNIDGQGHVISGLYCVTPKLTWGDVAFIGWYYGSSIQNLGIENSYFDVSGGFEGGSFIGYVRENCTLTNCYSTATVKGSEYLTGGFVGDGDRVSYDNCFFAGKTDNQKAFSNRHGNMTNCYYLEGSGNGDGTVKSAEAFASGEVTLALGTEVFGQRIGGETTDAFPKFVNADNRLYSLTSYLADGSSTSIFSNINGAAIASLPANSVVVTDAAAFRNLDNVIFRETTAEEDVVLTCRHLVISDSAPFKFNQPFTAETATFKVSTPENYVWADGSRGWHNLCAPFDGTLHVDGVEKNAIPSSTGTGDYWLKELKGFNADERKLLFGYATAVEAGKPYILALPGESFGSESMAGGDITIEGTNVEMPAAAGASNTYGGLFFAGTLTGKKALDPDGNTVRYVLNQEGNAFVASCSAVAPFGAYIQGSSLIIGSPRLLVGDFEDLTTGIDTVESGAETSANVYDLTGRLVGRSAKDLDALPAGTYIVNGKKVIKK
ncbi:MAG: leucine-rich repeat domain-containing protein [Alloprevotella sp.]